MSSPMMKRMLGFCCCCAAAGTHAAITAESDASKPSQMVLVVLMVNFLQIVMRRSSGHASHGSALARMCRRLPRSGDHFRRLSGALLSFGAIRRNNSNGRIESKKMCMALSSEASDVAVAKDDNGHQRKAFGSVYRRAAQAAGLRDRPVWQEPDLGPTILPGPQERGGAGRTLHREIDLP